MMYSIQRTALPLVILFSLGAHLLCAQAPQAPGAQQNRNPGQSPLAQQVPIRPNYVLGPNDQVLIRFPESEEINERPFRIDNQGFLTLPTVGRLKAEGLTVQALEAALMARLREFFVNPSASIAVVQFRNEPVFFLGAFQAPGIYGLQGGRTLVEMLATVGGLQPSASRRIKITRSAESGPIPLPNAVEDPATKSSTVEINLQSLTESINPAEDLILKPYDKVVVDRAERIYVSGEVGKVSSIELGERESISVAQALTEAGGFTQFANRDRVRVLRPILGTNRRAEFEIDLKRVFEGKDIDFPLLPNDVLYVPRSGRRSVLTPMAISMMASIPFIIVTAVVR